MWCVIHRHLGSCNVDLYTPRIGRKFAEGEVQIKRKELDMKRGMLETSLEVDMWDYAWQHRIRTRNLIVRKKDVAPDGTGSPPLNQFSRNHVSVEECKRRLHYSLIPGTAALIQIPSPPQGNPHHPSRCSSALPSPIKTSGGDPITHQDAFPPITHQDL
jgi:hypothetical protein